MPSQVAAGFGGGPWTERSKDAEGGKSNASSLVKARIAALESSKRAPGAGNPKDFASSLPMKPMKPMSEFSPPAPAPAGDAGTSMNAVRARIMKMQQDSGRAKPPQQDSPALRPPAPAPSYMQKKQEEKLFPSEFGSFTPPPKNSYLTPVNPPPPVNAFDSFTPEKSLAPPRPLPDKNAALNAVRARMQKIAGGSSAGKQQESFLAPAPAPMPNRFTAPPPPKQDFNMPPPPKREFQEPPPPAPMKSTMWSTPQVEEAPTVQGVMVPMRSQRAPVFKKQLPPPPAPAPAPRTADQVFTLALPPKKTTTSTSTTMGLPAPNKPLWGFDQNYMTAKVQRLKEYETRGLGSEVLEAATARWEIRSQELTKKQAAAAAVAALEAANAAAAAADAAAEAADAAQQAADAAAAMVKYVPKPMGAVWKTLAAALGAAAVLDLGAVLTAGYLLPKGLLPKEQLPRELLKLAQKLNNKQSVGILSGAGLLAALVAATIMAKNRKQKKMQNQFQLTLTAPKTEMKAVYSQQHLALPSPAVPTTTRMSTGKGILAALGAAAALDLAAVGISGFLMPKGMAGAGTGGSLIQKVLTQPQELLSSLLPGGGLEISKQGRRGLLLAAMILAGLAALTKLMKTLGQKKRAREERAILARTTFVLPPMKKNIKKKMGVATPAIVFDAEVHEASTDAGDSDTESRASSGRYSRW